MNTYSKFVANVFLAKCTEKHEKGETIAVETRHGKENDSIVFNLIYEREGFFYYSIVRADGFNAQEFAKKRAERHQNAAARAKQKAEVCFNRSHDITKQIPLGQPILVGHHSEARHRRDLNRSWSLMGQSVEFSEKAEGYEDKAAYWEARADIINLSMPESVEFFEFELEKAKAYHSGLKNGTIERGHSFSLTYSKKKVNDLEEKLKIAQRLWL